MPKQQHLNEVSVVHFAAARRRRAGWLPVRILRGANAATRAHVARVCACDKTRREEKEKLRRCCFCCRGRAASSRPFWRRRSAAPRRARWRRRGVGAAISRAPAASGAARPPCGANVVTRLLPVFPLSLSIGFVERPEMYRMCRRCTEGVQKVYRRCTEGVQKECTEGLNEKKAAYALTGWLYGPQGMPRRARQAGHRQQGPLSVWSSDIHNCLSCLCRGRTVRRGVPAPECTFCWKSLLKAFCTSAKGLLYIC